jgi:hypothetical protein
MSLALWRKRSDKPSAAESGQILCALHWQCWRENPPPLEVELADLVKVLPTLIQSGSVGLVWPRLRAQAERYGAVAQALEEGNRAQDAHNALVQREIAIAVSRLRGAGIEPVLVKGWSVARLYPEGLVRPAGDIDLVVKEEEFAQAEALLGDPELEPITAGIDLKHPGIWQEHPGNDFNSGTTLIDVDAVPVRVLSPEEQLRMLCIHFLKHEGMRPLWLADIALAVERRGPEFCWDRFIDKDDAERTWVTMGIALAHKLVGASLDGVPEAIQQTAVPGWLESTVYKRWQDPRTSLPAATGQLVKNPLDLPKILVEHWPGPVASTILCGAPMNAVPRFPWQLELFTRRLATHVTQRMWGQAMDARRARRRD